MATVKYFSWSVVVIWVLIAMWSHAEDLEKKPKKFYMSSYCDRPLPWLHVNDRKAIRIFPWNPPSQVPPTTDCVVHVSVRPHRGHIYRLSTTFNKMDMSLPSARKCITARLDLFEGNTTSKRRLSGKEGLCGKYTEKVDYSTTSKGILTMKFSTRADKPKLYENFEAIITPFHTGPCSDDELRCKNNRCIHRDLLCDGYNNCGDDSDEQGCKKLLLSIAAIIGIIVGCIVVVGIIVTVVICKCCCAVCGYEKI